MSTFRNLQQVLRKAPLALLRIPVAPRILTSAIPTQSKALPAVTSCIQRSSTFHTLSTLFQTETLKAEATEEVSGLPTRFDQVALQPNTNKAIKSVFKYETMSKVQQEVLALLPTSTDMFVKAKTGTGKTLAFLIPALETVMTKCDKKFLAEGDMATVLIVSPTRELAQQIAEEARKLVNPYKFNVHCLVGGESKAQQIRGLTRKRVDIVVGTPGRLNDMIESVGEFSRSLEGCKVLILDEADQLLDMGFKDSINSIVDALPKERQTLFFSATVSKQIKAIARTSLKPDFTFIDTVDPNEANTNLQVNQSFCVTSYEEQLPLLTKIIEEHKATNPDGKVMVFLNTTRGTQLYASLFEELTSYRLFSLHSKKSQEQRTRTSDRFRKSRGSIMFTSDVSARGVDYPDVSLVIQVGIPSSKEQYIHRLGRTGRAGKTGEGVLMITPFERSFLDTVSELPLMENESAKNVKEIVQDARLQKKLSIAKEAQDPELIRDSFTAFLGYYAGRTDVLTCQKKDILAAARDFVTTVGADEPPHLSDTFLAKLGFSGGRGGSRGSYGGSRSSSQRSSSSFGYNDRGSRERSSRSYGSSFGDRNERRGRNDNDGGYVRGSSRDRFSARDPNDSNSFSRGSNSRSSRGGNWE